MFVTLSVSVKVAYLSNSSVFTTVLYMTFDQNFSDQMSADVKAESNLDAYMCTSFRWPN